MSLTLNDKKSVNLLITRAEKAIQKDYPEFQASNYDKVYFRGDSLNPTIRFYSPLTYSTDSNTYTPYEIIFRKTDDLQTIGFGADPYKKGREPQFQSINKSDQRACSKLIKKLRVLPELAGILDLTGDDETLHVLKTAEGHKLFYRSDINGHYSELEFFVDSEYNVTQTHNYTEEPEEDFSWDYRLVKKNHNPLFPSSR